MIEVVRDFGIIEVEFTIIDKLNDTHYALLAQHKEHLEYVGEN